MVFMVGLWGHQWWVAAGSVVLVVVAWAVLMRLAEWAWWQPRRLEQMLRAQGLHGNRYRIVFGDQREEMRLWREALSKPIIPLSHCIVPRVAPFLQAVSRKYGNMSISWFGPTPRVIITDPELIREVLSNKSDQFVRVQKAQLRVLITGYTNYEGEKWARHRKIISPAFHVEKLKYMLPAFSTCCDELIRRWEKHTGSEGSSELDIWPELQTLTGDVISRTVFGSCYKEEGRRISLLKAEQVDLFFQSIRMPYIPGYRFLPTKKNNRRTEIYKKVQEIIRSIIERREKDMKEGKVFNNDLLGLLMQSNLRHSEGDGDCKNMEMTTDEVIEECNLFYFAGQETTASLLTWSMVVLSMHPEWQERAREEVLQILGKDEPEYVGLNRLKIVTMILYEVLRLYKSGNPLIRETIKEVKLGGITFPPKVQLVIPGILLHHSPELWGENVSEFKPDRFAEGIAQATKDPAAFLPFGMGPRVCIGQNFALLEAKMALAKIIQHFSFKLSPSYTHAPQTVVAIQPQYGAQIILHKL